MKRGYRTLDANMTVQTIVHAPQPVATQQAMPVAHRPAMSAAAAASRTITERAMGDDTFAAERLAKERSCSQQPAATMTGKGPGFENHSVPCTNGDVLSIRCEFGNCRILE